MVHVIEGKVVGEIGFGLMSLMMQLTAANPPPVDETIKVMKAALDAGCNWWNGAEFYGPREGYNSVALLHDYFQRYPEDANKVLLTIKAQIFENFRLDSSPEAVKMCVDNCVAKLGRPGFIQQMGPGRKDRSTPIEVTMAAYEEHVKAGRIGGVSLSECSAETIRRAAKVAKVACLECELSLLNTEILENGVAAACAELGIPILAYSPVGRGLLTAQITSLDNIGVDDPRRQLPRFSPENIKNNLRLTRALAKVAQRKGCTPAQLAINWVRSLSKRAGMPTIIPIPGTTKVERVKENAKIIDLTEDDMASIDTLLAEYPVVGDKYHKAGMELLDH